MPSSSISAKPGHTGITRLIKATGYSAKGLRAAFIHEAAVRQELALILIFSPLSFFLDMSTLERLMLNFVLVNVLVVELLNSAIEAVVDRVGSDFHELSGRAKDIGSAAVLCAILFAIATWVGVLAG